MNLPLSINKYGASFAQVVDADGAYICAATISRGDEVVRLLNHAAATADALEQVTAALWMSNDPAMAERACALEAVVKLSNPTFALITAPAPIDEESSIYALALNCLDCAPANQPARKDN